MFKFATLRVAGLLAGGGAAALLGIAGSGATTAFAASAPSPAASPAAGTHARAGDRDARRAVAKAVFEAEADVLGLTPDQLRAKIRAGAKISDLAGDRGLTKDQFADRLATNLRPRLEVLVDHKVIDQKRADKVVDRVQHGWVPFWDGRHKKA